MAPPSDFPHWAAPAFPDAATRVCVQQTLAAALQGGETTVLGRLFSHGDTLSLALVQNALGAAFEAFVAAGLLAVDGRDVVATVVLQVHEQGFFASDRRERHRQGAPDFVLGVGGATRRIASLLPPSEGAVLDLGCGCGVLGILAARTAERVVALDVNPRATAFTRFNAALNDCRNLEVLTGDLYAPVAGQRFDLIVCNAPYAVSPTSTYLYRDGGADFCERLSRATPAMLADDGLALLALNWPARAGERWQARLAGWFAGAGCDLWLLSSEHYAPEDYARIWLHQQYGETIPPSALDTWLGSYRDAGISELHGGFALLARPVGRAPWVEMRELPALGAAAGHGIRRVLAARDLAARHADAALLELPLRPCAALDAIEQREPGTHGWTVRAVDLRARDGLRIALRVDPLAAELLGWCDGTRAVAAAAQAFAQARGLPADALLAALPALLRKLLDAGLIGLPT